MHFKIMLIFYIVIIFALSAYTESVSEFESKNMGEGSYHDRREFWPRRDCTLTVVEKHHWKTPYS